MQKYLMVLSVVLLVLHLPFTVTSQKGKNKLPANTTKEGLHIYLLIGQSNMAGRADITGADADTLANVYLYTGNPAKIWEKAANPLNKYSSIRKDLSMQRLGPGYHFAKEMRSLDKDNPIGLVVNAKGGTSINEWNPGSLFYSESVKRTKDAMMYGVLKGILWHQGESDVSDPDAYVLKIITLIDSLRGDFNMPELPVVVGQLSEDKPERVSFNKMLLQLPSHVKYVGVVTSENTATTDSTHFNRESQRLMGERYAKEMHRLLVRQETMVN